MFIFLLVEFFFLVMRKLSSTFLVPEFTNCKNRGILIRTEQLTPKFFVEIFKTLCFISTSNFNSSFVACPLKYPYSEILDILQLFLSCIFYERNKIVGCTPNKIWKYFYIHTYINRDREFTSNLSRVKPAMPITACTGALSLIWLYTSIPFSSFVVIPLHLPW